MSLQEKDELGVNFEGGENDRALLILCLEFKRTAVCGPLHKVPNLLSPIFPVLSFPVLKL